MARARVVDFAATVVRTVAALAAYALSILAPSSRDLWVFGADSGNRFVGNPKYAFLHVANDHADEVRAVWVSDDPDVVTMLRDSGYEAHDARSPRGLLLTLLAEYVFVSHGPADATWWVTGGTDVVQCWHGAPIKTVGDHLDRDWSRIGRFFFHLTGSNWAYHVTTGEAVAPVVEDAYHQEPESVLPIGYPRNDLLRPSSSDTATAPETSPSVPDATLGVDQSLVSEVRGLAEDHPVAFYMPTWREWDGGVDHGGVRLDDAVDFPALDAAFAARDAYLLVKLHPRERLDVDLSSLGHVVELPADADPYPLLPYVDVLVTDYSSIYVDFLLTDQPVVFYPYDRPLYEERPGFEFDYDTVTPGPTPTEFQSFQNDLLDTLDAVDSDDAVDGNAEQSDDYAGARARVRNRFIDHPDDPAAERLYQRLKTPDS